MSRKQSESQAHVVVFPFPAIGHLSPLLNLATMLSSNGIFVTFVNTEFAQQKMMKSKGFSHQHFQIKTISDGLPDQGEERKVEFTLELMRSLLERGSFQFEKLVEELMDSSDTPPVTCLISDPFLPFVQDVANKHGIPRIVFWVCSVASFSIHLYIDLLAEKGYIPLKGKAGEEDELVTCIPGMAALRVKDLPGFLLEEDLSNFFNEHMKNMTKRCAEAAAVLFNSFDELDGPILEDISTKFHYLTIGPLLPQIFMEDSPAKSEVGTAIGKEDSSCLQWLDKQQEASVVYVGFGSLAMLPKEQVVELALGLEASGQPFLWAAPTQDLVNGQSPLLPPEFLQRTEARSLFVSWAPQLKVLLHPSVGCHLTHCGWNSTTESIYAGVPMICRPFFADNHVNRRMLNDVWKNGVELDDKNVCKDQVEKLVRTIIKGNEGMEARRRAHNLMISARKATDKVGSSYNNFQRLVGMIKAHV
eukprot:Gb_40427 [translate_table: standard]